MIYTSIHDKDQKKTNDIKRVFKPYALIDILEFETNQTALVFKNSHYRDLAHDHYADRTENVWFFIPEQIKDDIVHK